MDLPQDVRVTTETLWRGTVLFALLDAALLSLLVRYVSESAFRQLKRTIVIVTAIFWFCLWLGLASLLYWDRVYVHVFPAWSRWLLPVGQAALTAGVAALAFGLATRLPGRATISYCLLGGVWGSLAHVWAVFLGIVERPPMLRGASPLAAVVIAFFEFTFYFGVIVGASALLRRLHARAGPPGPRSSG